MYSLVCKFFPCQLGKSCQKAQINVLQMDVHVHKSKAAN